MTTITDPDWIRIFGTDSSILEKSPKPPAKPRRLKPHQQQAKLISDRPELLGGKSKAPTLFPLEADHD